MTKRVKYAGSSAGIPITPSQTLSESFGDVYPKYLDKDEDGKLMVGAETVVPYDPATGVARMPVTVISPTGITASTRAVSKNNLGASTNNALVVEALNCAYDVPNNGMVPVRTPDTFKSAVCTTVAATDVWTPAAGKKFRLMGFCIDPSGAMAAAGANTIGIIEETLGTFGISIQTYLPIAASVAHQAPIVVNLPGNGYLATTADKKLQVTLTTAVTAGGISITVWGTEE